jgi:hypothetical protein
MKDNTLGRSSFRAQFAYLILFMVFVFPQTLLAVGLSGGRILDFSKFLHEVVTLNPAAILRFIAWSVLIAPVAWIGILIQKWRLRKK